MAQSSSQPLVLEYKKRRFDGGNERELIEQIEMQYYLYEQQRLNQEWQYASYQHQQVYGNPVAYQTVAPQPSVQQPQPTEVREPKAGLGETLYKVVVLPYIELLWGISGLFIGSIMFFTMINNAAVSSDSLKQERHSLMHYSRLMIHKSLLGIVATPLMLFKTCLK